MLHGTWPNLRTLVGAAAFVFIGVSPAPGQTPDSAVTAVEERLSIPATDEGLPGAGLIRRYGWFQKLWQERRAAWAEQVDQDQGAQLFRRGNSVTRMLVHP